MRLPKAGPHRDISAQRCSHVADHGRGDFVAIRRPQVPRSVRAMLVVMRDVLIKKPRASAVAR